MQPTLNYLGLVICLVRTFDVFEVKDIGSTEKPVKLLSAKAKV